MLVMLRSTDWKEALLMEFRKIPGSEMLYRAVIGDSDWWESLDCLVFPVDAVRLTSLVVVRALWPHDTLRMSGSVGVTVLYHMHLVRADLRV